MATVKNPVVKPSDPSENADTGGTLRADLIARGAMPVEADVAAMQAQLAALEERIAAIHHASQPHGDEIETLWSALGAHVQARRNASPDASFQYLLSQVTEPKSRETLTREDLDLLAANLEEFFERHSNLRGECSYFLDLYRQLNLAFIRGRA
jgi:hypothetical protein